MENIIDLIATDAPASEIADTIKNQLFAKAGQRVEMGRPELEVEPDQETQEEE